MSRNLLSNHSDSQPLLSSFPLASSLSRRIVAPLRPALQSLSRDQKRVQFLTAASGAQKLAKLSNDALDKENAHPNATTRSGSLSSTSRGGSGRNKKKYPVEREGLFLKKVTTSLV